MTRLLFVLAVLISVGQFGFGQEEAVSVMEKASELSLDENVATTSYEESAADSLAPATAPSVADSLELAPSTPAPSTPSASTTPAPAVLEVGSNIPVAPQPILTSPPSVIQQPFPVTNPVYPGLNQQPAFNSQQNCTQCNVRFPVAPATYSAPVQGVVYNYSVNPAAAPIRTQQLYPAQRFTGAGTFYQQPVLINRPAVYSVPVRRWGGIGFRRFAR